MASFLDKLKKGMGVEAPAEIKESKKKRQVKVLQPPPPQELKIEVKPAAEDKEEWFEEPAGQLAIDVFQTERDLIIQAAIAGIKPKDLEVTVERDIVAIKGIRQKPAEENGDYFTKECYWGPFTREVIVPVEIDPDRVEATMQEGILTVKMPKILREKKRIITVKV